ncbi:hypothetical protein [Mucilaginibacter dorajii]|uniref:Tat pathway signal sequence domain protein n=1 Tax=Mucilaginibacter dorajii TaxID=692994 RepID=A0ABP7R1E6_9SPHI|nr:hypothetical protein [Mucilaginibacter dorajii]MCS3732222.1 hypothetical protein [Mucilaginibacter dorajii]
MKSNYILSRRAFLKDSIILSGTPFVFNKDFLNELLLDAHVIEAPLTWLQKATFPSSSGLTWGVPWPQGKLKAGNSFYLKDGQGNKKTIQSWPLAYWPDGSLKWTAHAATGLVSDTDYSVVAGKFAGNVSGLNVDSLATVLTVDTGTIKAIIPKTGDVLIQSLSIKNKVIATNGKLISIIQNGPDDENAISLIRKKLTGRINQVELEQNGPVRAVIKITGTHSDGEINFLPFIVRLYFFGGSDEVRIIHTLIYNADEQTQFIKGLGLDFNVPLSGELHNRHVRFVNSEGKGLFAEAVRGLTGLRRNPGKDITDAQLAGRATPSFEQFPAEVKNNLKYIPAFGDYTLLQGSSSGFTIRKRTKPGHGWLDAGAGSRALGTVYLGSPNGGLIAGIRNFWQSFPAQLDIRDAASNTGKINLWLWSPEVPAMDLRFYHDGMGEDTYEKQRDALDITYEDYEPGFGTSHGVARTNELVLKAVEVNSEREKLLQIAQAIENPPRLICDHAYLMKQGVFGANWAVEDRSTPEKASLELQLQQYFEYYKKQVDEHHWYGFWNYGDFMHTYDTDRHTWRYDVGGFGWDNSELSTDLWLWYYYLKTQRADVFHIAEAMTRHTGEVDVHHIGKFAPLGSRHNVMHWGDSAKQLRISTAANRRFYYYLTADERVGDLLREQVNAAKTLSRIQPNRKLEGIRDQPQPEFSENKIPAGFGTDYGAIAAAWLTEWERTGSPQIKQKLVNSLQTIAAQPHGFFTGHGILHLDTGKFDITASQELSVSHLNAVFGLTEIIEELLPLVNVRAFEKTWLQYCRLYNASTQEQGQELGQSLTKLNLGQGHSRLTAYAAYKTKDPKLAARAWAEFYSGKAGIKPGHVKVQQIKGPAVLNPVEEDAELSTNAVAQWGLAAIQCLAYVGGDIPEQATNK